MKRILTEERLARLDAWARTLPLSQKIDATTRDDLRAEALAHALSPRNRAYLATRPDDAFEAAAWTLLRRELLQALRRRQSRQAQFERGFLSLDAAQDAVHDLPARAPEPFAAENAAVRARAWDQWRREVRRAYAALPPDEKALAQALYAGKSKKAFAARMGWTLYRLYAVRKSLQARFLPLLKSKPSRFGAS